MKFKNINISKILYELLRSDLSINLSQKLSIFYKYLLACLYPLQISFDNFFVWRKKEFIISNCHWENGNLTNVLNLLFDN